MCSIRIFVRMACHEMGKYFATTHLKWREPSSVRRTREATERQSVSHLRRLIHCLIIAGLILVPWCVARLNPAKNNAASFPLALLAATCCIVFYIYCVPWLYRHCPSEIRVTDQGISRLNGNRLRVWKYANLEDCSLAAGQIGDEAITVLTVTSSRGRTTVLGIDESISLDELIRVLSQHGVSVDQRLF